MLEHVLQGNYTTNFVGKTTVVDGRGCTLTGRHMDHFRDLNDPSITAEDRARLEISPVTPQP
jgi:hypothetical protein